MCYRVEMKMDIRKLAKRFNANLADPAGFVPAAEFNGFEYPVLPVILAELPSRVSLEYHWGLIPPWSREIEIRKNTLNARVESLNDKPAFRDSVNNRCLVLATGYYEWRWNDPKGKSKQKFEIHHAEAEAFAFAGLYSRQTLGDGKSRNTFTIVTTAANPQMRYVHNNKLRMPLMLNPGDEQAWLNASNPPESFGYPNYDARLIVFPT